MVKALDGGGVEGAPYAELVTATNFSFLRGASHPFEMVAQAAGLGLSGIGICDRNSLSGVVRAYAAARDLAQDYPAFRLVVGARIVFSDGSPDVAVYPTDREAYGRLAALLTLGNRRAPKGQCQLELVDLVGKADGQLMIVIPRDGQIGQDVGTAQLLAHGAPGRVWLAASPRFDGHDRARLNRLTVACGRAGLPMLATMKPLYHEPRRSIIQDVLTCIRELTTIYEAGFSLAPNSERFIRHPRDMAGLFREHPAAIMETRRFVERISFTLDQLRYIYPEETVGNGETAQQTLERLARAGAASRYPLGIPERVLKGLDHELALIAEMKYAAYFLTVQDIVRFARQERGILCQGRGSAANSAVCFCLGITEVDPSWSTFCSNASSRLSATSRPISTSISSTSGVKR